MFLEGGRLCWNLPGVAAYPLPICPPLAGENNGIFPIQWRDFTRCAAMTIEIIPRVCIRHAGSLSTH